MLPLLPNTWGPAGHGVPVRINEDPTNLGDLISIDIETDEKDLFVGGCVYDGGSNLYYTDSSSTYLSWITGRKLIGHNVKSDAHFLNKLGAAIDSSRIHSDTMIMSYVLNTARESQGLKDIAKEYLGWVWPSYKDMVGTGRGKTTLDKVAVERVAEYCAMDTLAPWKLHELMEKRFDKAQHQLYWALELPTYKILYDMEVRGVRIDTKRLAELDKEFGDELKIQKFGLMGFSQTWNPNSPQQTVKVLNDNGIRVAKSDKPTLAPYKGTPLVDAILRYRTVAKLHSTYVVALGKLPSLPYVHTTFNQVSYQQDEGTYKGIRTGRLSSNKPNLQNIPAHDEGEKLRELFIPEDGKVMIDADYSQIEYRLLAHLSQEPKLIDGFNKGEDVHSVTAKALGLDPIKDRGIGKTLNFASIYGAQEEKIAYTAKVTTAQAKQFLNKYWQALPKVRSWMDRTLLLAKSRGGVSTMSGRWISLPDLKDKRRWIRSHAERAAINYIIQGSAADIIKVAMIALDRKGYKPLIQVHDELLLQANPEDVETVKADLKQCMESVTVLNVPLVADVSSGQTWKEAKK